LDETTINEEDARDNLDELVERARAGESFVVMRDGQPFARLIGDADPILDQLWADEDAFWKADDAFYKDRLDPACLMVFPAPTGILTAERVVASISEAPRWRSVLFSEHAVGISTSNLRVLAYRAKAEREGAAYEALCSSIYRDSDGRWLLILHQQTPV